MNVQPFRCGFFASTDFVANNRIKNLCATPCDRAETSGTQGLQCVTDWHPENPLSQMPHLYRGKSLDVKIRLDCAQSLQKIPIPFFLSCGMKSAYHVHLGTSEGKRISHHSNAF